jgi:Domain of unknown function (DUF4270)
LKPSKKTTTILTRFITCIPTWWAKAACLFPVLFFLISCEEDLTTLGFKSGQDTFKVFYAEIPIESSVLWMDSLRTSNLSSETPNRLLAGSYSDPVFGQTQAQAITQYRPLNPTSTIISPTAVFDSIVLKMRFDFYTYGNAATTTQTFDVYEITDELTPGLDYFFNSQVNLTHTPLGSSLVDINNDYFKEEFENTATDSVITLKVKLDNSFGQRLFDAVDPEDVNYTDFDLFKATFKGLAIVPQQSDKIVGFNPTDQNSSLIVYYHDESDTTNLSFVFSQGVTFSKIITDRSSTELSGLNQFHTDFDPGLKRYVQGGTSVITKLDFSKFYEYMDTVKYMMINSAELSISDVEPSADFKEPIGLSVSMMNSSNRYETLNTAQDTINFISFNGNLTIGDKSKFFISQGQGQSVIMPLIYSATNKTYSALPTMFFQQLYNLKSTPFPYWALRPLNPQPGKSVDRVVFPRDKIKLKIYYTRALINNE